MLSDSQLKELCYVELVDKFQHLKIDQYKTIDNKKYPYVFFPVVIIGSGAAGLRTAVELKLRGISPVIITSLLFAGTSACSGSDKQTLHTASTSRNGDNVIACAKSIASGGGMDLDTAYVEACGSFLALDGLRTFGVPIPQDRYGAVLRYQTDHDKAGRATSCGPRTSRLMVKYLANTAAFLGVNIIDKTTAIKLVTQKNKTKVVAVICQNNEFINEDNPAGLIILESNNIVLAGGGSGEIYRDSVYPINCIGTTGLAIEAGAIVSNLQEEQFGISTPQTTFPWNLSGTYMQSIPNIYSQDKYGKKYNFLSDYFENTAQMASQIFLKGYQWPVHAQRMLNFNSSLIDLAIFRETGKGNKVYLDFNENPKHNKNDPFKLENLNEEALNYLTSAQALRSTPIDRLRKMNPLAIELYKQHGFDISKTPLEVSINHQHFNGGVKVDLYGESSLSGLFAVGETAGTHGVTRPGGSALNSGQVFSIRIAEKIKFYEERKITPKKNYFNEISEAILDCNIFIERSIKSNNNQLSLLQVKSFIKNIMSDNVGFICSKEQVDKAFYSLNNLYKEINNNGIKPEPLTPNSISDIFSWKQLCSVATALAASLKFYIDIEGGSRGARVIIDKSSNLHPSAFKIDLSNYCIKPENQSLKNQVFETKLDNEVFKVSTREKRDFPDLSNIFFEKNWPDYINGNIFNIKE